VLSVENRLFIAGVPAIVLHDRVKAVLTNIKLNDLIRQQPARYCADPGNR
jgi:hypothetical protein